MIYENEKENTFHYNVSREPDYIDSSMAYDW